MSWEQWKQDWKDLGTGMYEGLQYQRGNYDELKTTLKDYGVPGLMGCGPLSDAADAAGFVGYLFAAGIKQNAVQYWENPTLYNLANLLTLGLPDTVKGAVFPEDYYGSPQNLLDIFGVASMFVPVGAVAGSAVRSGAKVVTSAGRSAMNTARSVLSAGRYAGKTVVRGPAARVVGRSGVKGTSGSFSLYRRSSNMGAFSHLQEPMRLNHVRKVIHEMGIDYKNIKIKIDRNPEMLNRDPFTYFGHTPDGKTVRLFPDAFRSREQLVKTLAHERVHISQQRAFGPAQNNEIGKAYETMAELAENPWWIRYKRNKGW